MNINKFEKFVELIEDFTNNNKNFSNQDLIKIPGLSTYKKYIYEAQQYLDNATNQESLTPLKKRLVTALSKFSETEIKELTHSLLTSYYTPEPIANTISNSIVSYLEKSGKTDIAILEPSAGSGNFVIALNQNKIKSNLNIIAIEKEPLTFNILKNNTKEYNNLEIINDSYENLVSAYKFDAIIGNVPFGTYKAQDLSLNKESQKIVNGKIHNYFFIKSIEHLNEGGIIALITSKELSDSQYDKNIREYLVQNLNLVSGIRLPDTTFKSSNTSVVTDLLVFQKPLTPKQPHNISSAEKEFLNTTQIHGQGINKYFNTSENILGKYELIKGYLGKNTISLSTDKSENDINVLLQQILEKDLLKNAIKELPNNTINHLDLSSRKLAAENIEQSLKEKYPYLQPGNLIVKDNSFYKASVNPEFLTLYPSPYPIDLRDKEKALALIEIREKFKHFRAAIRGENKEKTKTLQDELNNLYDNFYFFYNNINAQENYRLLKAEDERQLLLSLEKEITPGEFQKSEIFNQNFITSEQQTYSINNVSEAIYLSLNEYGHINEEFITDIYKKERSIWIEEALKNQDLYLNPIFNDDLNKLEKFELTTPSKFVSGFVEGKLSVYNNLLTKHKEHIGEWDSIINRNHIAIAKEELIKVIPHKLTIQEIDPALGEPWINDNIFIMFGKEHFQDPHFTINYNSQLDRYKTISSSSAIGNANYNITAERRYIRYTDVFNYALMQNTPEFTKTEFKNGKEIKVSDVKVNTAVQMAVDKLQNSFSQWLFTQEDLCKSIENQYHLLNNAIVKEKVDASYIRFDDIKGLTPYNHQKECALEKAQNNGGLIDHKVGAGKTLTMAMTTMLKKKFGVANKELVVGLNANFEDVYNAFKESYPEGNYLLVKTSDINTKEKAEKVFYQIANNNYDAVITSHSALEKFPSAPFTEKEILDEIIRDISTTLLNAEDDKELLSPGEMRRLSKKLNDAEIDQKRIVKIINARKETGSIIFDDLGFKGITVDESHEFKNLEFSTRHSRVAGLGTNKKVQKTRNLLSYIRNIQNVNQNAKGKYKGITFATGTTISNSISELYTLFRYLVPDELEKKGIKTFDQWARVYARKSQEYEESVTGKIKLKERFRYFVKVPELAKMYYDMTHFVDDNVFKLDAPELYFNLETVDTFEEQKNYLDAIKKFGQTKDFKKLPYYNNSTNDKAVGLICTDLGRKASLSLKLIHPNLPDNPNDKLHKALDKTIEFYQKFDKDKGTQLLFCDQGVPGSDKLFDIYNYMKLKLVEKGIPSEQIAFIHDYDTKKRTLFNKVNKGEIRIVLGSTKKMGIGVNMQKKIVALHHLDFPWRPSDLDQRNGRGGRPGNELLPKYDNKMPVFFYATKNTLDSYSFNILQIKQNFINQIKNASAAVRKIDEGAIDARGNMNFSEYMAACSPNQYLTEKLQKEKELQKVLDQKAGFEMVRRQTNSKYSWIQAEIKKLNFKIESLTNDQKSLKGFNPKKINNKEYDTNKVIAEILKTKLQQQLKTKTPGKFIELDKGFNLITTSKHKFADFSKDNFSILVQTPNNNLISYKSGSFTQKDDEIATYGPNAIAKLEKILQEQNETKKRLIIQEKNLKEVLERKFTADEQIQKIKEEIKVIEGKIEQENIKIENSSPEETKTIDHKPELPPEDNEEKKKGPRLKR